eukprot:m.31319 g.31319  ORF g.31319 m.31319 type:complete len:338 (+) comp6920_c0_seq1:33-1046(+)
MSAMISAASMSRGKPTPGSTTVVVHPLVLLSVVDHYNRTCKDTTKRAVGVLLGSWKGNVLDVANSFAVPFEEDAKNPEVYFLDHDYLGSMFKMFRKVNAREKIIGWYHTGPKLRKGDVNINEVLRRFCPHPLLVIIDVRPTDHVELPVSAYVSVEEVHSDGTPSSKTFEHLPSEVGAEEAEEVGVEHLLRDIKDLGAGGSLTDKIQRQLASLKGMHACLHDLHEYVGLVTAKKLPLNHEISYLLQNVFNLLPNMEEPTFVSSMTSLTSDQMLVLYLSALVRSTIALHNLINNKIENHRAEQEKEKKDNQKKDKAKSKKDRANDSEKAGEAKKDDKKA